MARRGGSLDSGVRRSADNIDHVKSRKRGLAATFAKTEPL
jgi:hypothetical protein